jgi:hypothetical protein
MACALLAYRGHVQIWRWARRRSAPALTEATQSGATDPSDARPTNLDPPPLGWIAVTVAAVIAIVVLIGRSR